MAGQRIYNPGFQNPNIARAYQGLSQAFWGGGAQDGSSTQLDYAKIANQEAQARRQGAAAGLDERRLALTNQWIGSPETQNVYGNDHLLLGGGALAPNANLYNIASGLKVGRGTNILANQIAGTGEPLGEDKTGLAYALIGEQMPAGGFTADQRVATQNNALANALQQQKVISAASVEAAQADAEARRLAAVYGHDQNLAGQRAVADIQAKSAGDVAATQAEASRYRTDAEAQSAIDVAGIQAKTGKYATDVDQATKIEIAKGRRAVEKEIGLNANDLDHAAKVYGHDSTAGWRNEASRRNFEAQISGQESEKSWRQYAADQVREADKYRAELGLESSKYATDQDLIAKKATAQLLFQGTQYQADAEDKWRRYAAELGLKGNQYAADRQREWQEFAALKAMESSKYGIDVEKTWREFQADKTLEAAMYGTDAEREAKAYAADNMLKGTQYGADVEKVWRKYAADNQLKGTEYGAQIEQMWRMYSAELALQGSNTAAHVEENWQNFRSRMQLKGVMYATDKGVTKGKKNQPYTMDSLDEDKANTALNKYLRGWVAANGTKFANTDAHFAKVPAGVWRSLQPAIRQSTETAGAKYRGKPADAARQASASLMRQGLIEINTSLGDGVSDFYMPKTIVSGAKQRLEKARRGDAAVPYDRMRDNMLQWFGEQYGFGAEQAEALLVFIEKN